MFTGLAFWSAVFASAAYLGITRDRTGRRVQRGPFLWGVIFILLAMRTVDALIANLLPMFVTLTAENFEAMMLHLQVGIYFFVGIPGLALILRLVSMRCRDAGYRRGLAYLGAVPVLQVLFWFWLVFPRSTGAPAVTNAA